MADRPSAASLLAGYHGPAWYVFEPANPSMPGPFIIDQHPGTAMPDGTLTHLDKVRVSADEADRAEGGSFWLTPAGARTARVRKVRDLAPDLRRYITRTLDLSGLAPRVAALFSAWQRAHEAYCATPPGCGREVEAALGYALDGAADLITSFEPRTLHEAVSLLACVFLDEPAGDAFGLNEVDQGKVLVTAKAFLAAHVAAQPEGAL